MHVNSYSLVITHSSVFHAKLCVWMCVLPEASRIPKFDKRTWPSYLILAVHWPATIDCMPDGWPPPKKWWSKDHVKVPNSDTPGLHRLANGSLYFRSVSHNDSGVYVCIAGNSLDVVDSDSINVTIACMYDTTYNVSENKTATLRVHDKIAESQPI